MTVLTRDLEMELQHDLKRIAARFNCPHVTLVVRELDSADGDVVLTDDDIELAIAAIRRVNPPAAPECECETDHRMSPSPSHSSADKPCRFCECSRVMERGAVCT